MEGLSLFKANLSSGQVVKFYNQKPYPNQILSKILTQPYPTFGLDHLDFGWFDLNFNNFHFILLNHM